MILLAHIKKELLLLSRDRGGLLVLFVMPMLLVLVLSLIQDNLFRATGETASRALFVNLDTGDLGAAFKAKLEATGTLELIDQADGQKLDAKIARQQVLDGDYQFAIVLPAQFSQKINAAAEQAVHAAFQTQSPQKVSTPVRVQIYFDPTVRGVYRSAVTNALQRGILGLEMVRKSNVFARLLPQELESSLQQQLTDNLGPETGEFPIELPQLSASWGEQGLIELDQQSAFAEKYATLPTSVQQNVPAWTLFGMFFIVIPLAGTLIRERQEGTLTRLMTMPVAIGGLLFGKVCAYLLICLVQFGLMLLVGRFLLPLLGTPVLELGNAPFALLVVAFSAALAACGYGILVGVLARSYDQASTFGSVSVVIAAALGGVMVPVYVMPHAMQDLSVISPLGWGLDAFLDIFVRQGNLLSVLPRVAALSGFSLVCIICAALFFRRWRRGL